ncbi:DUF6441 family protein [Microvirga vignae]|uniref:DUF6441 family protein n=1 Tax=Microvirga vignae TaxID=1225564 RepID=UPI00069ACC27|nr:DUF6441 family protein [Microvirga vignae]
MSRRPVRPSIVYGVGEFRDSMRSRAVPVAQAATTAIRSAAAQIKAEARANIAAAGFGSKWQNALRVDVYPKGRSYSINAAAFVYHKIPYAGVFEKGATIRGKPRMWVPLPNAPKRVAGKRTTPAALKAAGVKLFVFKGPSNRPIIAASMSVAGRKFGPTKKVGFTLSQLKNGRAGGGKNRRTTAVPLFVGMLAVTVKKRLSIYAIVERAAGQLARHYYNAFSGE